MSNVLARCALVVSVAVASFVACATQSEKDDPGVLGSAGAPEGGSGGSIGVGGAGSCVFAADGAAVAPLGDFCEHHVCPSNVDAAKNQALASCSSTIPRASISVGCEQIVVNNGDFTSGGSWVFDAESMQVVGFESFSDVAFGECNTHRYRYGTVVDCETATTCSLCDAGGEGGNGGASGAAGAPACP